jgi:uncharacterized repeat protein (TIGR02543 family)
MASTSFSASLSTSGGYSSSSVAYQGTYSGGKARYGTMTFSGLSSLSGATISSASISVTYGSTGSERYKTFGGLWTSGVVAFGNSETRTDSFILSDVRSAASGSGTLSYSFSDPETTIDSGKSYTTNYGSITSATLNVTYSTLATYTISYDANGGSPTPSSQTKTQGTAITLTTTKPSKSNGSGSDTVKFYVDNSLYTTKYAAYTIYYTFSHWSYGGSSYNSGASFNVDANCTLTASYSTSYSTSETITLPSPTKSGYTFKGWYTSASGGTRVGGAGGSYTPTASVSLYAQWSASSYTISYDANGGSPTPSSQTKTHGSALTLTTTVPVKNDSSGAYVLQYSVDGTIVSTDSASYPISYPFAGWSYNGTVYTSGASFTTNANCTLVASYNTINGNASAVTLPAGPTKEGYTFNGWYDSLSDGTKIGNAGDSYTPTSNITLYGQYVVKDNEVTLKYYTNGQFVDAKVKYYTNGQFVTVSKIKRWNGTQWEDTGV